MSKLEPVSFSVYEVAESNWPEALLSLRIVDSVHKARWAFGMQRIDYIKILRNGVKVKLIVEFTTAFL